MRLDNVVYSLGFASSRAQARQLVRHGHLTVNGRRVDLPSFQVKPGMEVALKDDMRANAFVGEALDTAQGRGVPPWLELDSAELPGQRAGAADPRGHPPAHPGAVDRRAVLAVRRSP